MLNGSPPISASSPGTSSQPAPSRRSSAMAWTSLPAGTGVWVVKTIERRASRHASRKARAGLHAVGDQLDAREDRVPLVEVIALDGQVERPQRAHPADAEQHLLGHPAVGPRVVEAPGDPEIARIGGLEQVEGGDGVAAHAPHAALDLAGLDPDAHARAGVGEHVGLLVGPLVVGVAVGADVLRGVALAPAEPDPHHREPEIAGRLHEVAREHPEAARVGVELLVQPVLHREVRHQRQPVRRGHRRGARLVASSGQQVEMEAHQIEHRANVNEHKIAGRGAAGGRGEAAGGPPRNTLTRRAHGHSMGPRDGVLFCFGGAQKTRFRGGPPAASPRPPAAGPVSVLRSVP